jgi:hypothetical protein
MSTAYGKETNKDGRHVGLDFYDLLIEAIMKSILSVVPTCALVESTDAVILRKILDGVISDALAQYVLVSSLAPATALPSSISLRSG